MDLYLERAGEIDVVLLDMILPGASGADVMRPHVDRTPGYESDSH